jgi:hypothetical protein
MLTAPPVRVEKMWGGFAPNSETDAKASFVRLTFDFEAAGTALASLAPQQLRGRSQPPLKGYGADLDRLAELLGLPAPDDAEESSVRERED